MRRRTHIALAYVWILTILVISCDVSTLLPASRSPATPTAVPPTATATATSTQTALPVSPTPLASFTPSPMPTSTESISDALSCRVISQSIKNGSHFAPKEDFEMGWLVRNNGSATWDPGSVDFAYFSGSKMYQFSPSHLQSSVDHGGLVALGASLTAPKNPGTYSTVWALRQGTYYFCQVSIRIIVP